MTNSEMTKSKAKPTFYYGWVITVLAALMYGVKSGILLYGSGPIIDALIKEYGWSNSEVGIAFSLKSWFGFLTPIVGYAIVKYGPRRVLWISGVVTAAATIMTAFATTPIQFMVTYGIGLAIGMVFTSFLSIFAIVNNWWVGKRGLHTGIVNGAAGIGAAIFVPLMAWMIASFGWQNAMIYSGLIILVFAVIPQWIFFRDRPEDMGLTADDGVVEEKAKKYYFSPVDWKTKDAIRTHQLWFVMLAWCGLTWAFMSVTLFAYTYLLGKGLSLGQVSAIQGGMGLFTVLGSLIAGLLVDKFGPRKILILTSIVNTAGILILIMANSVPMLWVYSLVLGLGVGMTNPCVIPMIASYYGNKNFGAIQGSVQWLLGLTAGLCPIVMGFIADQTKDYTTGFTIGIAVCGIAALLAWAAKPPKAPAHYYEEIDVEEYKSDNVQLS
ncbi:MFS transporter [Peribacillus frigoritolerans]|uniref:MFS transporter n=1 Tax=Peribacillus frigoritolerans TaxID=450367 RepID=UPI003D2D98D8